MLKISNKAGSYCKLYKIVLLLILFFVISLMVVLVFVLLWRSNFKTCYEV